MKTPDIAIEACRAMVKRLEHWPLDLVAVGSTPHSLWMFVFVACSDQRVA